MINKKELALEAINQALKTRIKAGLNLLSPACLFDICEQMGVAVWFTDLPSMDGFYMRKAKPKPAIGVSSLRPAGRKSITCGHELGHHVFGHGESWDELFEKREESRRFNPEEYQADLFSAAFHMPKLCVCGALTARAIDVRRCTPESMYILSNWLGVGYSSLIMHMLHTLLLLESTHAERLLKVRPREIRKCLLGQECPGNLIVVDEHWNQRPIDVEVGDLILAPAGCQIEGQPIVVRNRPSQGTVIAAESPGIGRVFNTNMDWAAFVRVTRKNYVGRAIFRFEEEAEDDESDSRTVHQ